MRKVTVLAYDECNDEVVVDSATVSPSLDENDAELFCIWFYERTVQSLPEEWKCSWWERNIEWQRSLNAERAEQEAWEQYLEECKRNDEYPDIEVFEERYRPDEFWGDDNWF